MMQSSLIIWLTIFSIIVVLVPNSDGKIFNKCEQISLLRRNGIPSSQISDWLCLIEHESGGNSKAMNTNSNKSKDWGIFQINDKYWCGRHSVGGDCKIACSKLVDNDINNDIKCAKIIYNRHKFTAWVAWKKYCQGKKLPSPPRC